MPWLSLRILRFEDWCSHLAICRAVSSAQSCIIVFSVDRCWFIWIIYMFMTRLILSCVMVIIALMIIFVTCISIWCHDLAVIYICGLGCIDMMYVCPYPNLEVLDPYSFVLPSLGRIEVIIPTILWLASVGFIVHYLHPSITFQLCF